MRSDDEQLTVFVITAGEESLDDCLAALSRQTHPFESRVIADVHPMSAAFQAMPERCETRYFVQVDADMILEPHAIGTLHDAIRAAGPRTFMVSGQLYEEGFGLGGAVKCWKRSLFRFFAFRDVRTVDRDLYRRMRRWGLGRRHLDQPIGVHRPRHSAQAGWLKAKGDVEKWRFLGRPAERYALPLLDSLLSDPEAQGDRLLGALLGAMTTEPRLSRSKDLHYERLLRAEVLEAIGGMSPGRPMEAERGERLRTRFGLAYEGEGEATRRELAAEIAAVVGAGSSVASRLFELSSR